MYYSNGDSKHHDKDNLIPQFDRFQLIGDSQFLRFSEQLLGLNREKSNGLAYLGLCVSGQKISDLLERVDKYFYPTSKRAVVMIGTNDLLQGTPAHQMRKNMESLICRLIERGVSTLIVLTVPPVPRLANSFDHWSRLKEFNDHIKSFDNGEDIFVVDAYSKFVEKKQSPRRSSFPYRDKSLNRSSRDSLSRRDSRSSLNEFSDRWLKKESRDESPDRSQGNSRRSSPNEYFDRWSKREPKDSSNESPERRYLKRESRNEENSYLKREDRNPGDPPKSLFSNIATPTPSERLPTRGALRISISTDLGVRDVYITEDNRESRETSFESCQSYSTTSSGSVKRSRPSYASNDSPPSPPSKRKSFSSFVEDDHNDRFCEDDGAIRISGIADEINLSLFEEYFSRSSGRKDLIHLNYNGLRIIRNLIIGAIRRILGD